MSESSDASRDRIAGFPIKQVQDIVYSVARRLTRHGNYHLLKDLEQAILLRLLRSEAPRVKTQSELMAFVMRIGNLERLEMMRPRGPGSEVFLDDAYNGGPTHTEQTSDALDLRDAISSLSEAEQTVITGIAAGGDWALLASDLKISPAKVRQIYQRSLKKLKDSLTTRFAVSWSTGGSTLEVTPYTNNEEIQIYIDPGDASAREVADVLRALNELHQAAGGLGLEFGIGGTFVTARQGVPA